MDSELNRELKADMDLIEAAAYLLGNEMILPWPEGAEARHAVALLRLQAMVEESE